MKQWACISRNATTATKWRQLRIIEAVEKVGNRDPPSVFLATDEPGMRKGFENITETA
jgi:hypothetical protein